MSTREQIREAIDRLPDDKLSELFRLIQRFEEENATPSKPGILTRLRSIVIDGPPDLAANLDLYATGEKRVSSDIP